jgi:hypothetical protein
MKLKLVAGLTILGLATLVSSPAFAATTASGTVAVTATVASSVSLTFVSDPAGIALGGTGTSAATIAFGNVQAYGGVVPANVTKTLTGVVSWTLSTPFDVVVEVANQVSPSYTLTAQLAIADAVDTWKIGASTITSASATSLTAAGTYGTTAYTLGLTIPFTKAAGAITNTINFVATAN